MDKSCRDCPSYVPPEKVLERTNGVTYGLDTAYCATKGIPLGMAVKSQTERAGFEAVMAEACVSFGQPIPERPTQIAGFVGSPGVAIMPRGVFLEEPSNCRNCGYFVDPSVVKQHFSWPVAMCLAKGNLLPPKLYGKESKGCLYGVDRYSMGTSVSIESFKVLPIYAENVSGPDTKAKTSRTSIPNPREYETDAEVDEEDRQAGIRAWRVIPHPKRGNKQPVYLPIFDPSSFSDEEQEMIPQVGDRYRPELYVDHAHLLHSFAVNYAMDRTPALIGPAGTGKTEAFVHLAFMCQLPFARISISGSSEITDVLGKHLVKTDPVSGESVTIWVDGRVPKRWRKPGVLLIDEPNAGPNDLWQVFRPLTDNASQLVLDQDEGQTIDKHNWLLFGMAMNPAWDPRYVGVNELNEADGNRLGSVWVDYPPDDVERDIIISKCNASGYDVTNSTVEQLMKIGTEIRRMADPNTGGEITVSWGVRLSVAMAMYSQYLTLAEAANMTIGDRLDPDQRELILGVVRDHETEN